MFSITQHEPKPLSWWYEQYRQEKLDMDPSYQRRAEVWSRWKRAHLIDSIINGYDLPKFYVADFGKARSSINEAKRPYAVIDGKQRFNAIFEFFDNELSLNSSSILDADEQLLIGGATYLWLKKSHPRIAATVENFKPVIMSVNSDDKEYIQQLFIRLNSGEAVNRAEKRNAMAGPVPGMIADLTIHPFFQKRVRFSTRRMQDNNLAAKLLLIEFKNGFVDTKANDLDKFVGLGIDADSAMKKQLAAAEERTQETLEKLASVFRDSDLLLSSQGNIPIFYWAIRKRPSLSKRLREFVQVFLAELKENLQLTRDDPEAGDAELSAFYTAQRSTNDQASLKLRYEIFARKLAKFAPGDLVTN
jgi:hypothetical protein